MKKCFFIFLVFFLFSCKKKSDEFSLRLNESTVLNETLSGKKLMENNCYLCHSPNPTEQEGRIGPPMIAIKVSYLEKYPAKHDFIAAIMSFTENPSVEKAILYGDIEKYGLMPKQKFSNNDILKIASYMYDFQIETPDWFENSMQIKRPNWQQTGQIDIDEIKPPSYADIGLSYALETKKVLGEKLMFTMQNQGVLEALTYCNHQAIPLTDSMSNHYNATIRRVSEKNRNPNNKAHGEALKMIDYFNGLIKKDKTYEPMVVEHKNYVDVYFPIVTNSLCLQCHGQNIKPEVSKQILKLYPQDLAIGYEEHQLRGIWHISFKK